MAGTAPDDTYFAEQSPDKRALLEKLRSEVRKAVPGADVQIKWGVPFYLKDGKMICSIASFKEFVGINIFAPVATLADPKKQLAGTSRSARMYKIPVTEKQIDAASVQRWLTAAVKANSR